MDALREKFVWNSPKVGLSRRRLNLVDMCLGDKDRNVGVAKWSYEIIWALTFSKIWEARKALVFKAFYAFLYIKDHLANNACRLSDTEIEAQMYLGINLSTLEDYSGSANFLMSIVAPRIKMIMHYYLSSNCFIFVHLRCRIVVFSVLVLVSVDVCYTTEVITEFYLHSKRH